MRPIDGDALRDHWLYQGLNEPVYCANDVLSSIDDAPTLDTIKQGLWPADRTLDQLLKRTELPTVIMGYLQELDRWRKRLVTCETCKHWDPDPENGLSAKRCGKFGVITCRGDWCSFGTRKPGAPTVIR